MKPILYLLLTLTLIKDIILAMIEYDMDSKKELVQKLNENSQVIKATYSNIKSDYIKIETRSTSLQNNAMMYVSKSSTNPNVDSFDFISIEQSINTIFIPKSYLTKEASIKSFYIGIVCPKNCDYTIRITFESSISLDYDTKYNYLTNEFNYDQVIRIPRTREVKNCTLYAIGGIGSDIETFTLEYIEPNKNPIGIPNTVLLNKGNISIFSEKGEEIPPYNEFAYYQLKISTKIKSYISIGIQVINTDKELTPFEIIYGVLESKIKPKQCFTLNIPSTPSSSSLDYTLNLEIINQKANVTLVNTIEEQEKKGKSWFIETPSYIVYSQNQLQSKLLCIRPFVENSILSFSLYLVNNNDKDASQQYKNPLMNGIINNQYLLNKQITYYRYAKQNFIRRNVMMTMKVIQGNPVPYFYKSNSFPKEQYSKESIEQLKQQKALITSHRVNDFYTLQIEDEGLNTYMSQTQNILIVQCLSLDADTTNCVFEIVFSDKDDYISVRKRNLLYKYINNQQDKYSFLIESSQPTVDIQINLWSFSGNIGFDVQLPQHCKMETAYVGNKQIGDISCNNFRDQGDLFFINVIKYTNGYYAISHYLKASKSKKSSLNINFGSSFIEAFKPKEGPISKEHGFIFINNRMSLNDFLFTFYPLNCNISLYYNPKEGKEIREIKSIDKLYQHQLQSFTNDNNQLQAPKVKKSFSYIMKYESMDTQVDYCMIYVSSNEIVKGNSYKIAPLMGQVVLNEASSHQVLLTTDNSKMSFLFPYSNIEGDLIINIILNGNVLITVTIHIEDTSLDSFTFRISKELVIHNEKIKEACRPNFLCNILIDTEVNNPNLLTMTQTLSIQIKTNSNTPIYIKKNFMFLDILKTSSIQYYYTDIELNEMGEIDLNYQRGSGIILARMIPKEDSDSNADWNGRVKFPDASCGDLLIYNDYLKRIVINQKDSQKCINGCDLYIAIKSGDDYGSVNYVALYTLFYHKANAPVKINLNEYITNQVSESNQFNYYNLTIPYDTNTLRIDFQSDICALYNKSGDLQDDRPYTLLFDGKNNDVFLYNGNFKQNDIVSFGITAEIFNAMSSASYVIKIDIPEKESTIPDLIMINSDQKVLCKTTSINSYCYFIYPIFEYDNVNRLFVFGYTNDTSAISIHANIKNISEYDELDPSSIKAVLPTKDEAQYSSIKEFDTNLLLIKDNLLQTDVYVLISVFLPKKTLLTLLTTFRTNVKSSSPNPSNSQLYSIDLSKTLKIPFPSGYNFTIYIESITGKGEITFVDQTDKVFKLKNKQKLNLMTGKDLNILQIKSNPDFTFVINYALKPEENFDEMKYGSSYQIIYRNHEFPLLFYTKLLNDEENIVFNVKLEFSLGNGKAPHSFDIQGLITDENIINRKKRDKFVNPQIFKAITGIYDETFHTAKIYFKSSSIKELDTTYRKYLFISLSKKVANTNVYTSITSTVTTMPFQNWEYPLASNVYFHGTFITSQTSSNIFQLMKSKSDQQYFKIEFSSNSDDIDYALFEYNINSNENYETVYTNSTAITSAQTVQMNQNGKRTILLDVSEKNSLNRILISIFSKRANHKIADEYKTYYTLRYATSSHKFPIYSLGNNGIIDFTYTKETNTLDISFHSVRNEINGIVPAKYTLRVVSSQNYHDLESKESIVLNAKTPFDIIRLNDEDVENKETVKYTYHKLPNDAGYIVSVVAIVKDNEEVLVYHTVNNPTQFGIVPGIALWLIIVITLAVILVIGAILGLYCYIRKLRNKYSTMIQTLSYEDEDNTSKDNNIIPDE